MKLQDVSGALFKDPFMFSRLEKENRSCLLCPFMIGSCEIKTSVFKENEKKVNFWQLQYRPSTL